MPNGLEKTMQAIPDLQRCPFCNGLPEKEFHARGNGTSEVFYFHFNGAEDWCPCKSPSAIHVGAWKTRYGQNQQVIDLKVKIKELEIALGVEDVKSCNKTNKRL